jgi:hypothetical protein
MLMPREPQPWGGEVQLPRWIRRLLKRPIDPGPSAESMHEARQPQQPEVSVQENADRAIFGGFSEGHPGNRPPSRRR